MNDRFYVYLK
ncbi:unnamed protein product, partial [Rotaria sordida]